MIAGRPLRFLALVAGGWVAARGVMLWPGPPPLAVAGSAIVPSAAAAGQARAAPVFLPPGMAAHWYHAMPLLPTRRAVWIGQDGQTALGTSDSLPVPATTARDTGIIAGLPTALRQDAAARATPPSRWFGSAWLFVRGGRGRVGGIVGPQLGGSQAGARLAYALTADRRVALAARVSSPLGKGMRELALGVEWQPTRLPVRVIVEQRIAVSGGRGGPTIGLVGGAGPLPIAAGFDLEAYAQGGVIGRDGGEGYADGAVRVAQRLATLGGVRIDLGGGMWGAAQKGASRLDIGPSLTAHVPLGKQRVRVSLDWRQRVAGNATPISGLVLSLGADF